MSNTILLPLEFYLISSPSMGFAEDIIEIMSRKLAFVLSGGGSRGALQVGALRAILDAGLRPDILVGTSIGACNAAFVAINGFNRASLDSLEKVWQDAASANLLPNNFLWLAVRAIFNRHTPNVTNQMRDFLITHGLEPKLKFQDLAGIRLYLVSADLNQGQMVLFGQDLQQTILDGVLASTAVPPWVSPLANGEQLLIDGGVISNLPIQAAVKVGAGEVIALDLVPPHDSAGSQGFGPFLVKLVETVHNRQVELECALAEQNKVPICHIRLCDSHVPMWDFTHTDEFISQGYETTRQELTRWRAERPPLPWKERFAQNLDALKQKLSTSHTQAKIPPVPRQ